MLADSPWLLGHAVCGGLLVTILFLAERRAAAWMTLSVAVSWWMIPSAAVHLIGVLLLMLVIGMEQELQEWETPSGIPAVPEKDLQDRWRSFGQMAVMTVVVTWIFTGLRLRSEMVPPTAPPDELRQRAMLFLTLTPVTILAVGARLTYGARCGRQWIMMVAAVMVGFVAVIGLNWVFSYHFPDGWDMLRDRISLTTTPWGWRRVLTLGAMVFAFLLIRMMTTPERQNLSAHQAGSDSDS